MRFLFNLSEWIWCAIQWKLMSAFWVVASRSAIFTCRLCTSDTLIGYRFCLQFQTNRFKRLASFSRWDLYTVWIRKQHQLLWMHSKRKTVWKLDWKKHWRLYGIFSGLQTLCDPFDVHVLSGYGTCGIHDHVYTG